MLLSLLYLLLLPAFFVSTQKNERKGMELVSDYFDDRGIRVAIIFACTLEESVDMLKLLMKNRTVTSKYHYFEMGPLFINMIMAQYDKIGFYLNFSCEFGQYMFSETSEKLMFNERNVWVLVSDYYNIIYELGKYNLQLDTDMLLGVITKNYSSNFNEITLYDIYKIRRNASIIAIDAGFWNKVSRLNIILEGTKTSRRSDFQGTTIKGTGVLTDLVVNETEGSFPLIMDISYKSHLDILNRFAFTMNMNLAQMYNFTIDVTFADDWGVGRPDPDGLFDGMLGEIERGRSELGLSTVIMNTTLMDIMDFSFPIWKFRPIFIFRNPRTFGTYHALLIPFTLDVWIFILTLKVLIVIILTCMKKINISGVSNNDDSKTFDRTWSENLVIIIGAFSAQGLSSCSGRLSERIILLMSLLVGMLLCTFYNSMVVTSLLMPPPPSIQTCEQLLESNLRIGITNITYYVKYFEMSNDELSKEFYKIALLENSFIGPEQGMYFVQNTEFAFYGEEATLYPIVTDTFSNREICRLVELELISPYYLPCPYKKRSPLKQFINSGLHLMRERGIVMRERKRWHREKPVCQGREDIPSIQLQTLIVAYIILLCGICLSLIIFTAEIFIYKRNNVNKNKKRRRNRMNEITENYKY